MNLENYVKKLNQRYQTGISREHSYRGDLQALLEEMLKNVIVTNEPARIQCGAPDYILTQNEIPIGYIEAKDIGANLNNKAYKNQFDRYRNALDNLIFTNYLQFDFYMCGEFTATIQIGKLQGKKIEPIKENFDKFISLILNFSQQVTQSIKSPTKLAEIMAAKSKLMAQVIEEALNSDQEIEQNTSLKEQMSAFRLILIHDIKNKDFADIYAQTIAYGLFAARYHDSTLPTFSRQEAATLIPKKNPFLRKLFQYIAGYDLDDRLVWIVDELTQVFLATDVAKIMNTFSDKNHDPVIHFYETFLSKYDKKLRKSRGVWYTPQAVVKFIVSNLDNILNNDFNIDQGLADDSKIKISVDTDISDKRTKSRLRKTEKEFHKVQILDPATGTGTFLSEIVRVVRDKFKGQEGLWQSYVQNHLIPRLNGFEILMASYSMAHLKLDMLLNEENKLNSDDQRYNIYLTNSLEDYNGQTGTLFASWLSAEASQASIIKRDTPVMIIVGNPPYSGESKNKGQWILNLLEDYKKEPGSKNKLDESTVNVKVVVA